MTDQPVRFSGQGGAGDGTPSPIIETPKPGSAQETATSGTNDPQVETLRKLLREEIEKTLPQVFEQTRRQAQSEAAKVENRIKAETQRQIEFLKGLGVDVKPETATKIEATIREQSAGAGNQEDTQPQKTQASTQETQAHPVDQAADEIMKEAGVEIYTSDPESKLLDHSSPGKYLTSLRNAAEAKAARVGKGRVPAGNGGPAGNPIKNVTDPNELWRLAMQKLK